MQGAQGYLKARVEERKRQEKIETVVLPLGAVNWEKPGKEIWLGERLFDLESFTVEKGMLIATGFFDDEETSVFNLLGLCQRAAKSDAVQRLFFLFQCFVACVVLLQPLLLYRTGFSLQITLRYLLPNPLLFVRKQPPRSRFSLPQL